MHKHKKTVFLQLIIAFYFSCNIMAQGETNIWYFGFNAGLDFNTNPPTPLTDGALMTYEGCASIADKKGNLVFYTDGTTVWNKNHIAMPGGTGLFGNSSSTQSAIIVPYPGTYNYGTKRFDKYFIITVDHQAGSHGVCYSEVDMTLNGGLGGVTATKNVHLYDASVTTEKICVVQHSNDCDFWVIGKPYNNIDYYSYRVTPTGFNTVPVISSVGPAMNNLFGSLKASPDNKTVVATHSGVPNGIWVYDFNNTTGVLSLKFSDTSPGGYSYSQEFSPDNKILYHTMLNNPNIYQYDLTVTNNAAFQASRQIIGATSNPTGFQMCGLQIASNGKIYAALQQRTSLGVINNPNVLGVGCGYVDMQQSTAGKLVWLGLPAIVTSLIRPVNKIILNDSCEKKMVQFGLLDTAKIISYDWSFASSATPNVSIGTSTISHPSFQFNTAGNYIVRAINHYACFIDTLIQTLTILPRPAISLTSANVTCFGLNNGSATATVSVGAAPYAYSWSNSGTTAAISGLSPAKYTLTVTDAKGCVSADSAVITSPQAALSISSTFVSNVKCFGGATGSASVIAAGGTVPYSYSWNTSPVQTNDTAFGLSATSYTVTVTDSNSCVKTATVMVTQPAVLAATASSAVVSCFAGNDGSATVAPTGGTLPYTYSWNTNPVQTTAIAGSLVAGSYTCTVTDSNSCVTSAFTTVSEPTLVSLDTITADTICNGQSTVLTALAHGGNTGGYTYTWHSPLFVGPNNTVSPTTTTTYSVVAMDSKSCLSAEQTVTVKVNPLPTASITGTIAVCKDANEPYVTFVGASGTAPYTFFYKINGGVTQSDTTISGDSVSIPVPTGVVGTYTYALISVQDASSTNCIQPQSGNVVITVNPHPVAMFGSTKVCDGSNTLFTDSSTTASGILSTWAWDFGDATPLSNVQSPSHLYLNAGNYTGTLIVNNSLGCADTITNPVKVYFNPIAGFTFSNVCFGDTMHFADTSVVDNSTSISGYLWDFGDGSPTNNLQNPGHYYATAGVYTVTLVTTSIDGCTNATTNQVKAFDAPTSAFSFNDVCLFDSAMVVNATVDPLLGITSGFSWDYGDGSPLNTTVWSPHHLYNAPGIYQLTLITHSSNLGCPDTLKDSITVFPMPVADFGFTNVCFNQQLPFADLSTISSGSVNSWAWSFGDGNSNNIASPFHSYGAPASYNVTLVVTTDHGCKDTVQKTATVHPLPQAHFAAANVCDGTAVQFINQSTILTTDTIQTWRWNFGDGAPLNSSVNTSHLYASNGSYQVQLHVTSTFGCVDSITKTSVVNPNPVVAFKANDTVSCEPLCINLQNLSSIASGVNSSYLWNFGDGATNSILINPSHCYVNDSLFIPNKFSVTLTVSSDSGCVTTLTKTNYLTVYAKPVAAFTALPQTATLTDPEITVKDFSTGVNFWSWNFGDTSTSMLHNPLPHNYADTGVYLITLITSTQYNCTDTAYQTVIIEPDFTFYIPNAFTPDGDGINDTFIGKGSFIKDFEMNIFDRWGNLLYHTDSIAKPWDGRVTQDTEIALRDVYVYDIKITDFKMKKHKYRGTVTLVR